MPTPVLKYSKQELIRLIKTSLAISRMSAQEWDLFKKALAHADEDDLIDLFAVLRKERIFLDKIGEEFSQKFFQAMDQFQNTMEAALNKSLHFKKAKKEPKNERNEKKIEEDLLKKLKDV